MSTARRIPIANIYRLLCYSWELLDVRDLVSISSESQTPLAELFARILDLGVSRQLKQGIARTYREQKEEIPGIRGRLDLGSSLKRASFSRASAVCIYDELSSDTLPNQIIKATLRSLARVSALDHRIAEHLRELHRRFPEVSSIPLTETYFRSAERLRKSRSYEFLLDVCELVYRNLLTSEQTGETLFRDFTEDDDQMARLFERFLLRFYAIEQSKFKVKAKQLVRDARGQPEHLAYLPRMQTDICLASADLTIVMDAKYYSVTLSERFGKESIRSSHLYQLFSYMHHLGLVDGAGPVGGILLYPRTTRSVDVPMSISGYPIRVAAINLDQPWGVIELELLRLLEMVRP